MIQYRLIKNLKDNAYTLHNVATERTGDDWYEDILKTLSCNMDSAGSKQLYQKECKEITAGTLQVILEFSDLPLQEQFQQQYPELLI